VVCRRTEDHALTPPPGLTMDGGPAGCSPRLPQSPVAGASAVTPSSPLATLTAGAPGTPPAGAPVRTPPPLLVYSRRPRSSAREGEPGSAAPGDTLVTPALDGDSARVPAEAAGLSSPAAEFIRKLSRTQGGILPIPHVNKRRKKKTTLPPSEAPRRSRRLAGLGADVNEVCPMHLKKRVMRALDLDVEEEREQLSQQILEDYAQRFQSFLADPHTRALAALFGWTPPDDDIAAEPVECLI